MIKNITIEDITVNPDDLNEMMQRFIDPADKRYSMLIKFSDISDGFINELINTLKSKLPTKILTIKPPLHYRAQFSSASLEEPNKETYGHDLDIENRIKDIPISQDLGIETKFTLNQSNIIEKNISQIPCAKTIFTKDLQTSSRLGKNVLAFNRRIPILDLLYNESISFEAMVSIAKKGSSPSQCWVARPKRFSLKIITWLNVNPIILLKKAAEVIIKRGHYKEYKELLLNIKSLKIEDYPIK